MEPFADKNVSDPATVTCAHCGATVHPDDAVWIGDTPLCPACAATETFRCDHCGGRFWNEENCGGSGIDLCEDCLSDHYCRCEHCGTLIPDGEAYFDESEDAYFCEDCYHQLHHRESLHSYSYKPAPIFYGGGPLYLGVELESDDGGQSFENAAALLEVINTDAELAYVKTDGSLNDGLELVSHPCTLDFHLHKVPWQGALSTLREMGYRSHNAGTCGLHVHVNRSALGKTLYEQEEVIARMLYLFERFWQEILRFSRRTESQIDHWAARYGYKDSGREILEHAKVCGHPGRYACINLTNADTVEFRVFRGTLRYATFAATLQFVDRLCRVALANPEIELRRLSWPELVLCLVTDQTPELAAYLKERRLYPNEPVCSGTEV